ncbi:MAG TPA: dihydropteroate synthase [Candidatus Acidoferrales bacterium]|nr:dihydropteroate synthase [Candidatus Acidoferrales bacterium]
MLRRKTFRLRLPSRTLVLGERTLVMGVLNVTPDSFSDGGLYARVEAAVARAFDIEREGADILDIGGESARPGSEGISAEEELARVEPVLEALRGKLTIPISIDTQKSDVALRAALAGAELINDISALRSDPQLADVARMHRLPVILMHMRGTPRNMQKRPFARDILRDVTVGLRDAVARARKAGLKREQLILDPGIGFGKSFRQNYELLAHLDQLARLGYPLLVGTSRKTFIGATVAQALLPLSASHGGKKGGEIPIAPPSERIWGTAATITAAILGGAHIVRVHDVAEMVQVARTADAVLGAS